MTTPSVVGVYDGAPTTAANPTVSIPVTPAAGDVFILFSAFGNTGDPVLPSAVTGAGATWSQVPGATGSTSIWVGVGATASGTVTATAAAQGAGQVLRVYHLRGVTADVFGTVRASSATLQATASQIAIGYGYSFSGPSAITGYSPSTGWTAATDLVIRTNYQYNTAYYIPTAPTEVSVTSKWATAAYTVIVGSPVSGSSVVKRNLAANSSFDTNINGWSTANATSSSISTVQKYAGTQSYILTASAANAAFYNVTSTSYPLTPVKQGQAYTISAYVYCQGVSRQAAIGVQQAVYSGASNATGGSPVYVDTTIPANTWTRVTTTVTPAANAYYFDPYIRFSDSVSGDVFYLDAVQIEEGTVATPYFDGYSTTAGATNTFTSSSDLGTSVQTKAAGNYLTSAFSATGTLSTSGLFRRLTSTYSAEGTLSTSLKKQLASAFSGTGALATALSQHHTLSSAFSGTGVLSTSGLNRTLTSAYTAEGGLLTSLGKNVSITSDFLGESYLDTELLSNIRPERPSIGKLVNYTVGTSAVPLNPAGSNGGVSSVSATYTGVEDPEFTLGETITLANERIGTYTGEVISVGTNKASGVMSVDIETVLAKLNTDLTVYPHIAQQPSIWFPAQAIDYWSQQCRVFYDQVPGDVIAYASGFGHTLGYLADFESKRFAEAPVVGSGVLTRGNRQVRTLAGSGVMAVPLKEVEVVPVEGEDAIKRQVFPQANLGLNDTLAFSVGVGILGTGRTASTAWTFKHDDAQYTITLRATSAGDVTATLSGTRVSTVSLPVASVSGSEAYRLTLTLSKVSDTTVQGKLTVHTDDLQGQGMLIHDGVPTTLTYPVAANLDLLSITHGSTGGSGDLMYRYGTYLSTVDTHPMDLPRVQKLLKPAAKAVSFIPGFDGRVWDRLNEYCSLNRLGIKEVDGVLMVGQRDASLKSGTKFSGFTKKLERRDKYRQVALMNQNSKASFTKDALLHKADSVISVTTREVSVTTVQTKHSIMELSQPVCVDGISPFPYKKGTGQYVVTGADGYIISPAWWADNGGSISVALTDSPGEIEITVKAPEVDNDTRSPYRISEGAADRPALYITGAGVLNTPTLVTINTGAKNAREGYDSVFDSPFLVDHQTVFDAGAHMAREYAASNGDVSINVPADFNDPGIFGTYPAGSVFTDGESNYLVTGGSQTPNAFSGNAVSFTTIAEYKKSFDIGDKIVDEKARFAGRNIRKFNIKPLKEIA